MTNHLKALVVVVFAATFLLVPVSSNAITKEEVITLTQLRIPDAEILKAIQKDRTVFNLQVEDLLQLKKGGVSPSVIKFMLETPTLYGDGHSATTPLPPQERPVVRPVTNHVGGGEISDPEGLLSRGKALNQQGDYFGAIRSFQHFLGQGRFSAGTNEAYVAEHGIAMALLKAGFPNAAISRLAKLLTQGPKFPYFESVFYEVKRLRRTIQYYAPELDMLADYRVGHLGPQFVNAYNYMLGQYFYDYSDYSRALGFLRAVAEHSADGTRALYLIGLIEVDNKLWKTAMGSFKRAILAFDVNRSSSEVVGLAYLALARISFEVSDYLAAQFYYRQVPRNSKAAEKAHYESVWTYFIVGDTEQTLRGIDAVRASAGTVMYPELDILEATTYLNLEQNDASVDALRRFDRDVLPFGPYVADMLNRLRRPADVFEAVRSSAKGNSRSLDPRVANRVLADDEFVFLLENITNIQAETRRLEQVSYELGLLGPVLLNELRNKESGLVLQAGVRAQRALKRFEDEVQNLRTKSTEIEVALDILALEKIDSDLNDY